MTLLFSWSRASGELLSTAGRAGSGNRCGRNCEIFYDDEDQFMTDFPLHPAHVVVTTARNEVDAGVIVAALEVEGIEATMSAGAVAGYRLGVMGDVQVLVAEKDAARATEIIRKGEEDEEGVDWSNVDVGEPEDE
jgi:Putative prokaryotic signal transducing protein